MQLCTGFFFSLALVHPHHTATRKRRAEALVAMNDDDGKSSSSADCTLPSHNGMQPGGLYWKRNFKLHLFILFVCFSSTFLLLNSFIILLHFQIILWWPEIQFECKSRNLNWKFNSKTKFACCPKNNFILWLGYILIEFFFSLKLHFWSICRSDPHPSLFN